MEKALVGILMGSGSDLPVMDKAAEVLKEMGVPHEVEISSAHRLPEKTANYAKRARKRGIEVLIAGAGMAAHLPGVVASHTIIPVIGVPLDASPLGGMDALLSIVQMPPGIPVATVAVGKAGAKNAGYLAAQILALGDLALASRLAEEREENARGVLAKDADLQRRRPG